MNFNRSTNVALAYNVPTLGVVANFETQMFNLKQMMI